MRSFPFASRTITDDSPCALIAEIGNNHGGDVASALLLMAAAKEAGWDAAKFQIRDNANLYSEALRKTPYDNPHSFGPTYGEHRDALELSPAELAMCVVDASLPVFATAFDERSVDVLEDLQMPMVKVASGSVTDRALLTRIAQTRKPVILSTGGSTIAEIDCAVALLEPFCPLAILHCTAAYPVRDWSELNLRMILTLRTRYPNHVIGWSGHDSGIAMALVAYSFGARIIEKHVTLNRAMKGTDHAFSLEPKGLATLCEDLKRAHVANGDGVKRLYDSERAPLAKMRRTQTLQGMKITGEFSHVAFH